MRSWVIGVSLFLSTTAADYVPGTPGGAWTEEELLVYKGKIRWIIQNPKPALLAVEGGQEVHDLYMSQDHPTDGQAVDSISPNLAKLVRLTFHDCIKEDNGAGCNGCLNFEGMGNLFSHKTCFKSGDCAEVDGGIHPSVGPFKTDNNNLLWVAKVLEAVYRDPNFGASGLRHLETSLFATGKSRADLWAFAGLVALQFGAELNNKDCKSSKYPAPCLGQIDASSPDCSATLPTLNFKSGRSDCIPSCEGENKYPFCTITHEVHPNQHANGDETVKFFKDNFDLTPKESVALMGVHTLGHPNEFNSMFRHYPWTRTPRHLNNFYYINMVNTTLYRNRRPNKLPALKGVTLGKCDLPVSAFTGDEYGNPREVAYRVRSEGRTESNGPWNWNVFGGKCSLAKCNEILTTEGKYHINSCCHYAEECVAGSDACPMPNFICKDGEDCDVKFVFQRINMLSPDMGLYYKFDVAETGRPIGCQGLEDAQSIEGNPISKKQTLSNEVHCELNDAPASETETMAEVVKKYAEDNQLWLNDFVPVYEKMLENGVNVESLTKANEAWFTARCNGKHLCTLA